MRTFRSTPRCRWLAWTIVVALLAPYLVMATPVRAQSTAPNVYVLDFNNKTKVGGQLLGRLAAAQMSLQLSESDNWFVIPDAQVTRRQQELNIEAPFDRPARVQIANGIDATGVVYGTVLEARVGGQPPQAYVKLQVVVEDVSTGVLINGAIAEGASTPRMGFTGDADILLEEALGKAAFKARESMDRFKLPEGTVLNTTVVGGVDGQDIEALVNVGGRNGVRRGMEMIVTRQRQLVGKVKIVSVDSDISTARVLENTQGVRPEDRVTAIFNFADFGNPSRARSRAAVPSGGVKLASADPAQTGGGVEEPKVASVKREGRFIQFRTPQDAAAQFAQATVQPPPPVVVDEPEVDRGDGEVGGSRGKILNSSTLRLLVGGMMMMGLFALGGRGGRNSTRSHGVEAFGFQPQIGQPGALIRVSWERPKSIRTSQILQYIVWRADTTGGIRIVGAVDNDATHALLDSEATRDVNAFDGDPNSDDAGGRSVIQNVPGVQPGQQYRYQVATAYENGLESRDDDDPPVPDDADFMSPLSMSSPWVTAITPAIITDPIQGEQVQLDTLPVMWQQTPGADTYVIWLSRNPNFPDDKRVAFGPFRTLPVDLGGDITTSQIIDASGRRQLSGAPTIYITVGAKNSSDAIAPKPRGWIFSAPVAVQPETPPPDPPVRGVPGSGEVKPGKPGGKGGNPAKNGGGRRRN